MRKIFISLSVLFCLFNLTYSQVKPLKLIGSYQQCPFHCESIKLNSDFTFDYLLDGDLFNGERNKGTWKIIEKDKIYLQSFEPPLDVKANEKIGNNKSKLNTGQK